jgi:DNA-3-methyladenine glycosylase
MHGQRLPGSFFERELLAVAAALLNKVLVRQLERIRLAGRIVEVEAYAGQDDPASHAYRGPRRANKTMFGPKGVLYVYFTYGMHHCANVVCGLPSLPGAVLLRALEPLEGVEEMQRRRGILDRRLLCSGPARLAAAFGIDRQLDGADLVSGSEGVWIEDDGTPPPSEPARGKRIGIREGLDKQWRLWVADSAFVSRPGRLSRAGVDAIVKAS